MNISGIRTYAGFYEYNTIKSQEERLLQMHGAQEAKTETQETSVQSMETALVPQGPDQGAIDYANQYQPDATYELKGVDSDIARLDVEKALSDMKKDEVLMQYQFFVGSDVMKTQETETRELENFFL